MPRRSKPQRRSLTVDGINYQACVGRDRVDVWDPARKRHSASHDAVRAVSPPNLYPLPACAGLDDLATAAASLRALGAVTPFQICNWIRTTLQNKPPVVRPAPAPAAPPPPPVVAGPVREVYLVACRWYHSDSGRWRESLVEVHLDPRAALDAARARNERHRAMAALHDSAGAAWRACLEAHREHPDRWAFADQVRARHLAERGIADAEAQKDVIDWPSDDRSYRAVRAPVGTDQDGVPWLSL